MKIIGKARHASCEIPAFVWADEARPVRGDVFKCECGSTYVVKKTKEDISFDGSEYRPGFYIWTKPYHGEVYLNTQSN